MKPSDGAVAALIPAAGSGTRLGGERKQDRLLGDAPLLVQTLRRFDVHPAVDELVVAAPADEAEAFAARLGAYAFQKPLTVVEGGTSRRASVHNALGAVSPRVGFVLVHDAVRPFVSDALITAVLDATRRYGAALPALPVADTVRRAADGVFGETVPRDGLYLVQTPQGFRRDWLEAAHALSLPDAEATDDAVLVQQAGHAVRAVAGETRNFKITTPEDWALARLLWAHPLDD